jgi:dTDP-4-dehydrorhamnose 3,5-epimerase/CDP-3, 6-dideoxy-D-glycero-D-glycero-4-hexulose-5-epimerase
MSFAEELLQGTWLHRLHRFTDRRGTFVKTFSRTAFEDAGIDFDLKEEFYSTSNKDVIRGMHFQLPPFDHVKLVYCASGAVQDVLLDLRRGPGFGRFTSVALRADEPSVLVIAKGIAHGFRSLTDNSLMVYKTSSEYVPSHDAGVRWDSFGFDWGCGTPVLSERDAQHPTLTQFTSPF